MAQTAAAQPSAPTAASAPPADGQLVTSQRVLPAEAALGFADIATSTSDAVRAWQRFRLVGSSPPVAEGTVLLFVGRGESGTCPFAFERLEVQATRSRSSRNRGCLPARPTPVPGRSWSRRLQLRCRRDRSASRATSWP